MENEKEDSVQIKRKENITLYIEVEDLTKGSV